MNHFAMPSTGIIILGQYKTWTLDSGRELGPQDSLPRRQPYKDCSVVIAPVFSS